MKKKTMTTLAALTLGFVMSNVAGFSAMAAGTGEGKVTCHGVGTNDQKPIADSGAKAGEDKKGSAAQTGKDGN